MSSNLDANQIIQRVMDESTDRLRVDAIVTATIADVIINSAESSIAIGDQNTGNLMTVNADGSINTDVILASTSDNVAIGNQAGTNFLEVNADGSINTSISGTVTANQGTPGVGAWPVLAAQGSAWSVTANAGTNLNTSLLALDSTVAKDASLTTLNTSVNTLLKPANTLAAVTTLGSITSVVHVDDNGGSLTVDNSGTFPVQATLSAETTKVIGTVNQGTSPWITSVGSISGVVGQTTMSASLPVTIASNQTSTPWAIRTDQSTASVQYIGKAVVGTTDASAGWQILRITATSTTNTIEYAGGSGSYTNIWNNRASFSYS